MSSLVDGRIERRLGVAIVAAASTVLKKVDESRSLSGSTRSTTAQLPSPLPSPPPATTQLSSSSSSALTPRRSASDHTTVLLTHSTPPQSPFMDDKPIIMRLNTGSNATMPAATTTTVTPDDDNQNSSSIINLIVDEPATSMTTSSMTPTASSTTTTTSTTQIGEPTSTTTIVDSSQHQQQQQAPHTPPESNDGTQSSTSEMKLNGEELARKLAHYNSLNAAFKNETLSARLESTRRRLRSIHSAVFNRHLATYLASNSTHTPDQMIGDEIAYEIARRREDDDEEDEDDDDDDDNMSLTSSSSSEQPDDDQLVYAAATPRENDSSTKNSTGDVHFVDNSELNLLNNLCADDYWSMQRVKLGSEWQRLQTKMAYLRRTNEQVNKYVRSEREIEKLSKSLKDSIRKTFSVSDEDVDTEEDRSLADHSSASSSDYSDQEEEDEETSRRVMGSSTTTTKRRSRQGAGGGLKQVVRFDDEIVLKSFYVTLMNLRTGLFKEACVCGGETASRAPQVAATRLEATKSCIFCHMFKKYDGDLVDRAANRVLSLPTRDLSSSVDTTPQDQESNYSIRADERVIKLYHSYCKQPKYGEKLQWTRVPLEVSNKRHKAQPLRPRNHVDDEMSVVVGDEYTDLSSLVNERLNRLFGCHSSRENRENENNSSHSGEQADKDKSQPPCSSNIVLKDDFDEIEIDPGYEISLDDIKKLPDFSYDELKFLCGDELWLEENDDEPKTKLSNSRKRKEQDEDEMARFDEQKRLRLDSNR